MTNANTQDARDEIAGEVPGNNLWHNAVPGEVPADGQWHMVPGNDYVGTGYFYAPYVPLTGTAVVLDPDNFTPRQGILTRYGARLLREGAAFYSRLNINTFETERNEQTERLRERDLVDPLHLKYDPRYGF